MSLDNEIGNYLLQVTVLTFELLDLLPGGIPHRVACQPFLPGLHELFGPGVVVGRFDPLSAAQVGDGRLPAESFQNDPDLLFRRVLAACRPADALHEAAGFTSSFLGLLGGRRSCVSLCDFGHDLAPSSGIYPRELIPADLSISSGPKCVPFLLTANTRVASMFQRTFEGRYSLTNGQL